MNQGGLGRERPWPQILDLLLVRFECDLKSVQMTLASVRGKDAGECGVIRDRA